MDINEIRDLLDRSLDWLESSDLAETLCQDLKNAIDHIDNNFVVLYYP